MVVCILGVLIQRHALTAHPASIANLQWRLHRRALIIVLGKVQVLHGPKSRLISTITSIDHLVADD